MSTISTEELRKLVDGGHAPVVLDVRSAIEFARGHVPGAVHVPFWLSFRRPAVLPPADTPVVLYCGHGPRAAMAAWVLRRRGLRNVHVLSGHMAGWRRAHLPEERGR